MGKPDGGGPVDGGGFVGAQPGPLGSREGGRRDAAAAGATGELLGAERGPELGGLGRGADVVPEQRGVDRPACRIEGDQAVLLAGDRDGGRAVRPAGPRHGLAERPPPLLGVALASAARADGVRGAALPQDLARVDVDGEGLGGLGRAVDSDDDTLCGHAFLRGGSFSRLGILICFSP